MSNNPTEFRSYGEIGIMIAMIKGNCSVAKSQSLTRHSNHRDSNTIIGNKVRSASKYGEKLNDEIVLQQSGQCLPLIKFKRSLLDGGVGYDGIAKLVAYFNEIQKGIDFFFNEKAVSLDGSRKSRTSSEL